MNANGRYAGHVSITVDGREAFDLSPFDAPEKIDRIDVNVAAGPEFHFETLEVSPLAGGSFLPEIQPEERADSGKISQVVLKAIDDWKAAGHADARVKSQDIVANHARHTLRAKVTIDPGPLYHLGDLHADPDDPTLDERVKAVAGFEGGAVYSPARIEASRARLQKTNAYRSVSFEEEPNPKTGIMDVQADLVPQKKRRITTGVEFESPGGLTISSSWMHRNYKQQLQTLSFDGEISNILGGSDAVDLTLGATLKRPATLFTDTDLTLSGTFDVLQEPTYSSQEIEVGGEFTRDFKNGWIASAGTTLGYTVIQDDLGDRTTTDLSFPLSMSLDRRDNKLNPQSGFKIAATATPIFLLESGKAAAHSTFDIRKYHPVEDAGKTVIAGRVQGGTIIGADYDDLPPSLLFNSGGGGTVRGHAYQELSINRRAGVQTGGTSFIGASVEIRREIFGDLGGVAFLDAGWLGDGVIPEEGDPWQAGAGFGVRYTHGH